MALTEKMWKAEVDAAIQEDRQRIENLSSAIGSGEMLLANTIDKDIQALERKEEILWKMLGVSGFDEFKQKWNEVNQFFKNFTGPALAEKITKPFSDAIKGKKSNTDIELRILEAQLQKVLNANINILMNSLSDTSTTNKIIDGFAKAFSRTVLGEKRYNGNLEIDIFGDPPTAVDINGSVMKAITKFFTFSYDDITNSFKQIDLSGISNGVKIHFQNALEQILRSNPKLELTNEEILSIKNNSGVTIDTNGQQITVEGWYDITKGLKGSDIQKKVLAGEMSIQEVENINNQIISYMSSFIPDGIVNNESVRNSFFKLVQNTINNLGSTNYRTGNIESNIYSLFVGVNTNEIIGLLGELKTQYILSKFPNLRSDTVIDWTAVAREESASQQLHADIIVRNAAEQIGIQVKNSQQSSFGAISFGNMGLDAAISTLQPYIGNIPDAGESIEDVYQMVNFNIEYIRKGKNYTSGANPAFSPSRKELLALRNYADKIMSLLAATFMHMQTYETEGYVNANVLYVIGNNVFSGAQNLRRIKQEFRGSTFRQGSFHMDTSGGRTIVDVLNEEGGFRSFRGVNSSSQIKLTSSFKF